MSAGERGGVLGGVAAVIAALFYGAWTVSRTEAPEAPAVAESAPAPEGEAPAAAPEATPETGAETGAETVAETGAEPEGEVAAEAAAEAVAAAPEATEAAPAEPAPEAVAAEDAAGTDAVAAVSDLPPAVQVEPPSLDLVRVEQDGSALVAGSAEPASDLSLRVTGQEIVAVPADGQGNFVAMFNLAPSPAPRVLSLVMELPDGTEVPAEGTVVIAPTVAPVVAPAATDPATGETVAGAQAPVAEAPAALLVTEEGARVLQSASDLPPELVANVTIDTITYTPEGAVQLAGRGTPERLVRLYLDNAPLAEAAISGAGNWAVTLPEVAPGLYTLRADQVDATGAVTSRFETPFQRETVEALAAAAAGAASAEAGDGAAEMAAEDAPAPGAGSELAAQAVDGAAPPEPAVAAVPPAPVTVTVQPGFTLWQIATEQLGAGVRYVQVFEANRDQIRDPDLIYPGQVFAIPEAE